MAVSLGPELGIVVMSVVFFLGAIAGFLYLVRLLLSGRDE
jgi:hypothetical protein